jgi:PAS domain S-box-containing protein
LAAFAVDLYAIVIVYQAARNHLRASIWVASGLALVASLWTDALVFRLTADFGNPDFVARLGNDLLGKTFSALILWPLAGVYLTKIAPHLPDFVGNQKHGTFEVVFGSFGRMQEELKRSTMELRQSEDIYRQLTDNVNQVFWISEVETNRVIYVNPAYEKIWGRSPADIYENADAFIDTVYPEDRNIVLDANKKRERRLFQPIEYRIVRPDSSIRWIWDRSFPVYNEDGKVYRRVGIAEDVTERKASEEAELALELERERVKLLRDFISDASHDLKTPLTIINTKIGLVKASQKDPARHRAHLDELEFQVVRLGRMIDDLLTLSRLDNTKDLTYRFLDVNKLIQSLVTENAPLAEARGLTVKLDLDSRVPNIAVDQVEFKRALGNLLENATFYTERGGTVTLRTLAQGNELVIDVSDTGIGISEENLPHIFDRFYRANRERSTEKGGTGLGLAIVKKVVAMHGGTIQVASKLASGTTFSIILPTVWPRMREESGSEYEA